MIKKLKTFINPTTGIHVTAKNKADEKHMKACAWKIVKSTKQYFAKGLDGKAFFN